MRPIQIFKTGTHMDITGKMFTFGEADLRGCAQCYDPALHEAPIVVGHPKTDDPAYGWISSLAYADNGLVATPHQVVPEFAEMVKSGRFKKISAALYVPGHPLNPKPETYYLRHVGFLGAQPPALKGLRPVQFAEEEDGCLTLEFAEANAGVVARLFRGLRDFVIEKFGADAADRALPDWSIQGLADAEAQTAPPSTFSEGDPMDEKREKELKEREDRLKGMEAEFSEKEKGLKTREDALSASERARTQKESADFVEGLVKEGKVLPRDQAPLASLLSSLTAAHEIEFSEGEGEQKAAVKRGPAEVLKGFLGNLPKAVEFSEVAGAAKGTPPEDPAAVARLAQEYQESEAKAGRAVSITEAVAHVAKAK